LHGGVEVTERVGGSLQWLPLGQLEPDWQNPRFLPGTASRFQSHEDAYVFLDQKYDAHAVADSIARHGYFESEPLIAVPGQAENSFVVVEGNRRLTALKSLQDSGLRDRMTRTGWADLPADVEIPDAVPVLVVESRERVAPIMGFRHITGIAPWDPYQQARYVAELIDGDQQTGADEVAELIGRDANEVRAFYRNYSIVEQADEVFGISDSKRVTDEFGVWSRAMTSVGIRAYVGAPPPRDVSEREFPLSDDVGEHLDRLFVWLFGIPRTEQDRDEGKQSREGRAISDSRQLNRLGKAILHSRGVESLEKGADLETAERAMLDGRAQFAGSIGEAKLALEAAQEHRPARLSKAAAQTLEEICELAKKLKHGA